MTIYVFQCKNFIIYILTGDIISVVLIYYGNKNNGVYL